MISTIEGITSRLVSLYVTCGVRKSIWGDFKDLNSASASTSLTYSSAVRISGCQIGGFMNALSNSLGAAFSCKTNRLMLKEVSLPRRAQ